MKNLMLFKRESTLTFLFVVNSFLVFWYLSNSIVGNKSPATSLLLLLSLLSIIPVARKLPLYWESQKWWIIALVVFGLFNIASLLGAGVAISDDYDKPAKALAAVFVCLYLMHFGFSSRAVAVGVAIAALAGGGYAIYEGSVLQLPRAGTLTNPIRYGYLTMALGLLCFFFARYSGQRWQQGLLMAAGCVGLMGAYSTGTRGVLVILLSLTLFYLYNLWRQGRLSWTVVGVVSSVTLATVLLISMNTNVFQRYIDETRMEVETMESGDWNTSIGFRFQMWDVALYLGAQEPLTGVGYDYTRIREKAAAFIEAHDYNPIILVNYGHFHNQYLDLFAKQGVPGVLVWLLFLAGGLMGMKTHYRYAVLIIIATLAVGGLTEAVLRSSRLFYLTVLGISIFRCLDYFEAKTQGAAMLARPPREQEAEPVH